MLKQKKEQQIKIMKHFQHYIFSLFLLVCLHSSSFAQCKVSKMVENGKFEIDPAFLYDGFSLTNFTMDSTLKRMQVEFAALKGQRYKLYFCNSGFTEAVKVSVFKEEKDGTQSIDLLGANTIKDQFIEFDLAKAGNYKIDYAIPVCENAEYGMTKNECLVVLISYQKK
jgi:hypothetical protein